MDSGERQEKQRAARRRLRAQRARAGFLRGRVVVGSILCFAVLWAIVFAQMATGNDPVLSAKATANPTASASAKRHRSGVGRAASERVEAAREPEAVEEVVPEVVEEEVAEPEPELEPLTSGQS